MNTNTYHLIKRLENAGFTFDEAMRLRRIEKTLQRWSELECGDGNDYASWAIERDVDDSAICAQCGEKWYGEKALTENCPKCGDVAPIRRKATDKPYMVRHIYGHGNGQDRTIRSAIADREKGALKRLAKIMEAHPDFVPYHQGDPRGCALYIVKKSELNGSDIHASYTRGIPVCD